MESKEVFFTWKDIKRLFVRKKRIYFSFLLGSFFITLVLFLLSPIRYQSTATFKESKQEHGVKGQSEFLLSVLQSATSFSREEGVQSMFTSRGLLREVIENLGLQIRKKEFLLFYLMGNFFDNFRAEMGMRFVQNMPFHFSHVHSENQTSIPFFIQFTQEDYFHVFDEKKQKVAEGYLKEPINSPLFSFQLEKAEKKIGEFYSFTLDPWIDVVKKMSRNLSIQSHKKEKNILSLKFTHTNPQKSAEFLNQLMIAYQNYLKRENEEISKLQMNYLEKRQKELMEKYEESLGAHAEFLEGNLQCSGFMTLKQESETLNKPSEEYLGRLYDLDLQISRLSSRKKKKPEIVSESEDPLEKLYAKREDLLFHRNLEKAKILDTELEKLFTFLDQKEVSFFEGNIPQGFSPLFLAGMEEIQKSFLKEDIQEKKQHLKKLLEEEYKKKVEGKLFHELEGISPETAQKLYVEYNERLDSLRVYIGQLQEIHQKIVLPEFEIASLSTLLTDPVSLEMIQKAGQKTLELQDRANYSVKDIERIQNGLNVQKKFLQQHIGQILSLENLKVKLIEEKITSLQQTSIHQLEVEKELIQTQLKSLKERMKSLPAKWKRENELKMQRDLSLTVIEGLTQLAESKNIDGELFQVGSKPIDWAFIPYKPYLRSSFSFSFLIAMLLFFFFFLRDFFKWLSKGRVITEDFASFIGLPVCGFIRERKNEREEKEAVQKICTFLQRSLKKKNSSVFLLSESPSFDCEKIAACLSLRGNKVLLIECFAGPVCSSSSIGLYEYLSGTLDFPSVIQKEGFDQISSGVYHSNFGDLLCRERFAELVTTSLASYDLVLLSSRGTLSDAALSPIKDLSDLFILHVSNDPVWEDVVGWTVEHPSSLAVVFAE